jgi:hypothetical protein
VESDEAASRRFRTGRGARGLKNGFQLLASNFWLCLAGLTIPAL